MQVKSIAECSKGSILQYFRPSLSYHLSLRSLFCLFLSGCLTGFLFDLILNVPSTIFQLNRDRSSWVQPVLSWAKCVLLKDHYAVTLVRLEPTALWSRVKHSTTEPLRSLHRFNCSQYKTENWLLRPIIASCRSKVLQNAPRGAFCNTFDLH